ncbi:MAG: hybrid-cluster NAD(P)-dependent oxidoreductase [Methylobacter sp.]|nr:hybrid-cluster NAD(P)-dependent oxidoreductase [Methylobacter sp.]
MQTNDNKTSARLWVHRLFEQSSASLKATPGNTSYAKRYQTSHALAGPSPFSALFAGENKHQPERETDKHQVQQCFEEDVSLQEISPHTSEIFHASEANNLQAAVNGMEKKGTGSLNARFTVLNSYAETPDTKTFRLVRSDGQKFDYLPGQYITLSVVIEGRPYKRSYSLASSPSHPGILEITVKKDRKGGVVSNWLNNQLKVGDTLNAKGPYGNFSCAPNAPPKILFLAAGSGIVPIISMLRWLADAEAHVDISVLLSFRTFQDIIFRDELKLIDARHNNIRLWITLTKEPSDSPQWPGLTRRINAKMIADCVPDVSERVVYLCGPEAFMADCKNDLRSLKLPDEQLFCESFNVNRPIPAGYDSSVSPLSSASLLPAQSSSNKTGSYQIRFAKSAKTIAADGSRTLLALAEAAGINLAHECRAGNCGECMVKCLEGKVNMTAQAEIDDRDREKGWVYACCAYPSSNAVLDV